MLQKITLQKIWPVLFGTTLWLNLSASAQAVPAATFQVPLKPGVAEPYCRDRGQQDLNRCATVWFATTDFMLQQVIEGYTAGLVAESVTTFAQVQKAWQALRDQHCTLAARPVAGGSLYPLVYNGCRARLTNDRVADLQQWAPTQRPDLIVFQTLEANEQKLVRELKPGTPQLAQYLLVAQQWEQYRAAHCQLEAGQTAQPNVGLTRSVSCQNRLAQLRSGQVEGLLGLGW
jgi:uncharacterized protein YecT (DUF1311 family)